MAANTLTYKDIQDAVLGRRFPETMRPSAKRWIATAYADVWAADDWTFKRVSRAAFTLTAGDSTPTMPADFLDAIELYDPTGAPLVRMSQQHFEEEYADSLILGSTGSPEAYTVVNRQIEVAPIPTGGTYRLSYFRALSHLESDGSTVTSGFMDEDNDSPLWLDHQAVLIPRATVIGLMEINDPTWPPFMQEYERQLERMRRDYEQVRPQVQWAREDYC